MSIEVYETMSTAMMWLLLFVVAALALLIAALTKTKFTVQKISIIGIMAALSFVAMSSSASRTSLARGPASIWATPSRR